MVSIDARNTSPERVAEIIVEAQQVANILKREVIVELDERRMTIQPK